MTQATIRFICSACSYRARIPATYQGKVILCPKCEQVQFASDDTSSASGTTVTVSRVATAPAVIQPVSVMDAQGKIRYTCMKCGFQAKISGAYAGRAITCPGCKAPQIVPPMDAAKSTAGPTAGPTAAATTVPQDPGQLLPTPTPHEPAVVVRPQTGAAALTTIEEPPSMGVDEPFSEISPLAAKSIDAQGVSRDQVPATDIFDDDAGSAAATGTGTSGKSPSSSSSLSASATPGKKPGTGAVVRRAGRAGAAWAAEEQAVQAQEEADADSEAQAAKRKQSTHGSGLMRVEAVSKTLEHTIKPLRDPRTLAGVSALVILLVLCLVFAISWHASLSANDVLNNAVTNLKTELAAQTKSVNLAEITMGEQKDTIETMQRTIDRDKADLSLAKVNNELVTTKLSRAESDFAQETTKCQQTADQLDTANDRLRKSVAERDDAHQRMVDAEKARDEEARLRQELQIKYDELFKLQK